MGRKQTYKKRICIVTLSGYFNYGNKLQNLALQKACESFGCDVKTLMYTKGKDESSGSLKMKFARFFRLSFEDKIQFAKKLLGLGKTKQRSVDVELEAKRMDRFKQFSNSYIYETDFWVTDNSIPADLIDKFDCFIVGSDQVWHPRTGFSDKLFFLRFAPESKRAAYAPSFGVDKIPKDRRREYSKYISEIPYISVREASGKRIIKSLTGRDAEVVLDPTMLLDKEQWNEIRRDPECKPQKPYLLTCFLGELATKTRALVEKIANENKLEIIELANPELPTPYLIDPGEFIGCVADAALVMTDSFHTTVFSILYEVPFIVSERVTRGKTTVTRLHSLMNMFGFEDRAIEIISTNTASALTIDFSNVHAVQEAERQNALAYIKKLLEC